MWLSCYILHTTYYMIIGIDIRLIGKKRTGDEVVFFNLVKNLAKIDSKNEYKLFTDITDKKTIEEDPFF